MVDIGNIDRVDNAAAAVEKELNCALTVTVPEGFRELEEAEMTGYRFKLQMPDLCVFDEKRHIMISIAWKESAFISKIFSAWRVVKAMEREIANVLYSNGYKRTEFLEEDLGGKAVNGFIYSYEEEEIKMLGETMVAKEGKTFYYIHCYYTKELEEDSRSVLEGFFRSFRWKEH